MPLTQRFATAVATLPDSARAPLWRAWSLAPLKQRAVMLRMAERVWGGQGDVEGVPTRNQAAPLPSDLGDRAKAVQKLVQNLQSQYFALCKPWDDVWGKAFEQWRLQTNRPLIDTNGAEIPITDAEHRFIWELAAKLDENSLGFDTPNQTPCVATTFDLNLRAFFNDQRDLEKRVITHLTKVGGNTAAAQAAEATLMRELAAMAVNVGLWRKRLGKIANDIVKRFPRPGHGLPGIPNVGLILFLVALGAFALTR